jgi:hypothetical protein
MKMKLLVLLAAAGFACTPDVPQNTSATATTSTVAVFNTTTGVIPLPNDIVFQQTAGLPAAQQQLLGAFAAKGGFPSDQDLPITVSFSTVSGGTDGGTVEIAPDIDLATFVPNQTVFVFAQTATTAGPVPFGPITAADYVKGATSGTLSIHNVNHKPWPAGAYIAFVRGGANGVKTVGGTPIYADATFYLIAQGQELNTEANLAVLRAQTGSTTAAQAAAEQLDAVINQYKQVPGPFSVVDNFFPHQELATMTTFHIAATKSVVAVDPGRGIAPLPIDLLRDPRPVGSCPTCGLLTPLAACTFASGTFNAANGSCSQAAAAAGFATLDGFSTTGLITAPISTDLVSNLDATSTSINPATVQLYDLTDPAHPAKVDPTTYITEPAEVQQSGFSPVIALQPAGATGSDPSSVFRTKPLKDNTSYAVVISDGVKDQAGNHLSTSTVGSILQITASLVDSKGNSQLSGIDNNTAGALEAMRQQLAPVYTAAAANGIGPGHVVMAYTFKTQSILKVATQLGALPYQNNANPQDPTFNTGAINALTPAAAFAKYGTPAPNGNINQVLETTITTFNLLDPTTGAFKADPTQLVAEPINVLIATPKATSPVATCAGPVAGLAPLKCSPLVVFRHGLGRGRADMLNIADSLTAAGFTVVAIDAAKHGDRSFCTAGATTGQCPTGSTCVGLPAGAQGDTQPPGCCLPNGSTTEPATFPASCGTTPSFVYQAVGGGFTCGGGACTAGIPTVSANFLVTTNFFRTRDTLRQDFIDQSQLVRAVTFVPSQAHPHNQLFDFMAAQGVVIDPSNVSYIGQSLGSIQGAGNVATNPRISKAVLNVGGGTIVDVFTTSPAFGATTLTLLQQLGVQPGTAQFLQFLIVAKTVLDPADPVNFAQHLSTQTLPDLLNNLPAQAAKSILTQAAFCDQTVPNAWNFLFDSNVACGPQDAPVPGATAPVCAAPLPISSNFGTPGPFSLFFKNTGATPNLTACPGPTIPPTSGAGTPGAINHGFLLDGSSGTAQAQTDAVTFLSAGTLPPSLRVVP